MPPLWIDTQTDIQLMIILQAFGTSCPKAMLKEEKATLWMDGWESKGHTKRQLRWSTPHRGQKHKPSCLDEVSEQRCHAGIETFFLWILVVSFLNNKTHKGREKGLKKKKMKKDLSVAKSFDTAISTSFSSNLLFEDKHVSRSLELTSKSLSSTMAIYMWYWIRECRIKG